MTSHSHNESARPTRSRTDNAAGAAHSRGVDRAGRGIAPPRASGADRHLAPESRILAEGEPSSEDADLPARH